MDLIDLVNRTDLNIFVIATGAGAGITQQIWNTVGCSSFFMGSSFPYSPIHSSKELGYTPEKFVSIETSVDLAIRAYIKAYEPNKQAVGVGLTASVASSKIHRGDHKIIVSVLTDNYCFTSSMILPKGTGDFCRQLDGSIADKLAIDALLAAIDKSNTIPNLINGCKVETIDSSLIAQNSLIKRPYFNKLGKRLPVPSKEIPNLYYPGNFNPIHEGHLGAAQTTTHYMALHFGQYQEVIFTTTINPPHKAALSTTEALQRVALLQGHNFMLTHGDARYIDKARTYPGSGFIIGADAFIRMMDPCWGVDPQDLVQEFYKLNTSFYILGRVVDGVFLGQNEIENKFPFINYHNGCYNFVPGRWDVSSTEIRNKLK